MSNFIFNLASRHRAGIVRALSLS